MINETLLTVRVTPRASQNRHQMETDGTLRLWLTAPPVDGAANKAVIGYLAKRLDVPQSAVKIVLGHTNRTKRVQIPLSGDQVRSLLERK